MMMNTGLFEIDGLSPPEGGAVLYLNDGTIYGIYDNANEAESIWKTMEALAKFLGYTTPEGYLKDFGWTKDR